jgi:hypothetical protein
MCPLYVIIPRNDRESVIHLEHFQSFFITYISNEHTPKRQLTYIQGVE